MLYMVVPSRPFALWNNLLELQEVNSASFKAIVIFSRSVLKCIIPVTVYLGTLLHIHRLLRQSHEPVMNKDWGISGLILSCLARSGLQLEVVA